jgi:hypothetical protein
MQDDDANDLFLWLAALLFVLVLFLARPARAGEAISDTADNASERTPTLVQQGLTCRKGDPSNIVPSPYVPASFWAYIEKAVDRIQKYSAHKRRK